ncbi:MAG: PRC-barrel domain-containing protein [Anaerolineaceae bacterium]|nr:MAG: PRC-barrel domain-containing protein [Anaerolineaceae bacterium]
MRLGKDLENKPIISVTEGRMLGRTKDVYVDADLQELAGLYLGTEGMFRRRAQVIHSENVVLFGIDVVLVKDTDVITNNKELPEVDNWKRLRQLQGYEVHTPGGTKLGTVGDVILDETGTIVGISLSRVFVKGPLAEQGSVPREAIIEVSQEDEVISVDLATLEGTAADKDEKAQAGESEEKAEVESADSIEEELTGDAADKQESEEVNEPAEERPASETSDGGEDEQE